MTGEEIFDIVFLILIYNFFGFWLCGAWGENAQCEGFDLFNPYRSYSTYAVNWFGAIMISLVYTALCPLGAICYWFYKLCTIGR